MLQIPMVNRFRSLTRREVLGMWIYACHNLWHHCWVFLHQLASILHTDVLESANGASHPTPTQQYHTLDRVWQLHHQPVYLWQFNRDCCTGMKQFRFMHLKILVWKKLGQCPRPFRVSQIMRLVNSYYFVLLKTGTPDSLDKLSLRSSLLTSS